MPPKLIYLIFSAGQKTCKTSGRRTTYLTPGGPWLQRIVCQDRRRTGERSAGWTAGEAKGCDEIPGRGRPHQTTMLKTDMIYLPTGTRTHTKTQMDRCMMVHTYPLVFVMSSFVHTFLCADVLAYIIYLYKMSRLKGVEESLQLSPTDILHRQRMWRRSTPTTATIGVARREEALGWPSHGEYLAANGYQPWLSSNYNWGVH